MQVATLYVTSVRYEAILLRQKRRKNELQLKLKPADILYGLSWRPQMCVTIVSFCHELKTTKPPSFYGDYHLNILTWFSNQQASVTFLRAKESANCYKLKFCLNFRCTICIIRKFSKSIPLYWNGLLKTCIKLIVCSYFTICSFLYNESHGVT